MALKLIVKTPNCKIPVQTVECDPFWNVEKLKENLGNFFPTKSKDVRIIFSGKLLQDHLILKNIFTGNEETYTIHLVCSFDSPEKVAQSPGKFSEKSAVDAKDSEIDYSFREMTPEELKVKYSEYYNYVYQTYYNHLLSSYSGASSFSKCTPAANDAGVTSPAQSNLQQPHAANNQERQEFVQMAAAGGGGAGDEFEEGFNRDWIYYVFKFVMFSIIVYYSSALNALMLIGIFGVIYLLQEGWFRFDRVRRDVPRPNANPVTQPTNDTIPNATSESTNAENLIGINIQEPNNQQPSIFRKFVLILKLIGTFILTFFMSLIPEQPAPLNLE